MADLLSDEELDELLPDGWDHEGDEIVRSYEFDEYMHGVAFAQLVGEISDAQSHHPEITIRYDEVEIRLTSHEEGGVTDADVELAEIVEAEAQD